MLERRERRIWNLDSRRRLLSDFARASKARQLAELREWRRLLSDFDSLRNDLHKAIGQPSASRCTFNVFEVTRRSGFEVTTHSALLCDLLDPRGMHGQGGAFLKAFLAAVDANLPVSASRAPWPPPDGWWSVVPEFAAAQGRLDILLTNRGPSGPASIVIENKWRHGLGDLQLERYAEYLLMQGPLGKAHRKCLVYLTRSGGDPRIRLPVDFIRLSHSLHIAGLIQDTLESVRQTVPPALREPLLQYCEILGDDDA